MRFPFRTTLVLAVLLVAAAALRSQTPPRSHASRPLAGNLSLVERAPREGQPVQGAPSLQPDAPHPQRRGGGPGTRLAGDGSATCPFADVDGLLRYAQVSPDTRAIALPKIVEASGSDSRETRCRALVALSLLGDEEGLRRWKAALSTDEDPRTREELAASVPASLACNEDVRRLRMQVATLDADRSVRLETLRTWPQPLEDGEVESFLRALAIERDGELRQAIVAVLAPSAASNDSARDACRRLAGDALETRAVRSCAFAALRLAEAVHPGATDAGVMEGLRGDVEARR